MVKMTLTEIREQFDDLENSFVIDSLIIGERDEQKEYIYTVCKQENGLYYISSEDNVTEFGKVKAK